MEIPPKLATKQPQKPSLFASQGDCSKKNNLYQDILSIIKHYKIWEIIIIILLSSFELKKKCRFSPTLDGQAHSVNAEWLPSLLGKCHSSKTALTSGTQRASSMTEMNYRWPPWADCSLGLRQDYAKLWARRQATTVGQGVISISFCLIYPYLSMYLFY